MSAPEFSTLATERLILEPFAHGHSDGIFTLWSSPEVCRYSGEAQDWEGQRIELPARSPVDSDKILDFFIRRAAEGSGVRWAVISRESDRCLGAVGLNALAPRAELAYHIHPDHWGSGHATEACAAVIHWCQENLPNVAIEAFVEPENESSTRLARRLGFKETSALRDGARQYLLAPRGNSPHA